MTENTLTIKLIEQALQAAEGNHTSTWEQTLVELDTEIIRLNEQIANRPSTPVELSDEYRGEVDDLRFEHQKLSMSLEQTNVALQRAKEALKRERNRRKNLEGQLNDLEKRLLDVLGM